MNKTISLFIAAALSTSAFADDDKHETKHHGGGQMNHAEMNHDHSAEHDHGANHEHESHDHSAMAHDHGDMAMQAATITHTDEISRSTRQWWRTCRSRCAGCCLRLLRDGHEQGL